MPPVIDASDPTVTKLQNAARQLQARHVPPSAILAYVKDALKPQPQLVLPETFTATHQTGGLPSFPAVDIFMPPGTVVLAPEACVLVYRHLIAWDRVRRVGGWTCYLQGVSGNTYFDTHFATLKTEGSYARHQPIGTVASVPGGAWEPHIHHAKHRGRYHPLAP